MSTESINITITENGARRVSGAIDGIGHSAEGAERLVTLLERTLGALGLAATVRELLHAADAFTMVQNKIRAFISDSTTLDIVTDRLLKIANQTRNEFEATATTYARVGRAAKALGLSQNEALDFTQALSEAVTLSGVTTGEASRGVLELAHAFATGTIQTREFRVIMKDVPEVARAIADGLKTNVGHLYEMAAAGQLTAHQVVGALLSMRNELDNRMNKSVVTFEQSLTILNNSWEVYVGKSNNALGITHTMGNAMVFLADNIDTAVKILEVLVITIGVYFALQAIPKAIAALNSLGAALIANPFTSVIVVITAAAAALYLFSEQIGVSEEGFVTLHDLGVAVFGHLRILVHTLAEGFGKAWAYILETGQALFGDLVDISMSFPMAMLKALDFVIVRFLSFSAGIVAIWRQAMDNLKGFTGVSLAEAFTTAYEKSKDALTQNGKGPAEQALDQLMVEAKQIAAERVELDRLAQLKRDKATAGLDAKSPAEPGEAGKFKKTFGSELEELRKEGMLLLQTTEARKVQNDVMKVEEHLKRNLSQTELEAVARVSLTNIALQRRSEALETLGGPTQKFFDQMNALNAIMRDAPALTAQVTEELSKMQLQLLQSTPNTGGDLGSMADAYIRQLRIMQLETRNAVGDMGAEFGKLFGPGGTLVQGIGDAVAQSVVFGERFDQALKKVAQSIVANLISSLIQLGINMVLNAAIGHSLTVAAGAASVATATAVTAAWGPAATLVNAATFGAGAAAGTSALASSLAAVKGLSAVAGFAEGGWTGPGGRNRPAGVVHGQEYVLNASATRRLGISNLDRMNNGGGLGGGNMNVTVVNRDIPGVEFQVNQLSHDDVEIIAQRVVRSEAPNVIAGDIANPSGRTSRALGTHTTATRKRN